MRELAVEAINRSDIVFEGRMGRGVLKEGMVDLAGTLLTQTKGHHYEMDFVASRVYRGPSKRIFVVFYNAIDTPCAFDFNSGHIYLIFANAIAGTGNYVTHAGMLDSPIEKAGPALRVLGGEPPEPEDLLAPKAYDDRIHGQFSSVCGQVRDLDGKALSGAVVSLWSVDGDGTPPKQQNSTSDSDGSFCIRDVLEGKFWLAAAKYENGGKSRLLGYYPTGFDHSNALPLEVKGKVTVSGLEVAVRRQELYAVSFRIVPAKHKFQSKPAAIIVKSKNGDTLYYHDESVAVDDDGVARPLLRFPPGPYIISIFFGMRSRGAAAVGLLADEARLPLPQQDIDISGSGEIVVKVLPPE